MVGGIIPLLRAASFRFDGRLEQESAADAMLWNVEVRSCFSEQPSREAQVRSVRQLATCWIWSDMKETAN
jgi:hypothetical protein